MKNGKKILIAEDEQDILDYLEQIFINAGFEVITAIDGIQALKKAHTFFPDLFLLDIKMPNLEGTSVCEQLRKTSDFKNTPIVFLTAQNSEVIEIEAFKAGANDFINKPIKPNSLLTRINRLLPTSKQDVNSNNLGTNEKITKFGEIEINHDEYKVVLNGVDVDFARKEFQIIQLLSSKLGKVFTRHEVFTKVWGENLTMTDRTLDVHIRKIRIKAGDDFIKTVKGVGFKLGGV